MTQIGQLKVIERAKCLDNILSRGQQDHLALSRGLSKDHNQNEKGSQESLNY